MDGFGVGASVERLEDDRYMRGRGRFVADIRLAGMLDIAFVRSPLAHARLRAVHKPAGAEADVFTAADLASVAGIRADSGLSGFRSSIQPILATGKVLHVGEPIAACLATSRARAEDLAEQVQLDLEELPAVADMLRARDPSSPLVHEHWAENVFLETSVDVGFADAVSSAVAVFHTTLQTARQCMAPIEGRGVVAVWDNQAEQLVVTTSTQQPHIVRSGLAECLGMDEGRIRVIAPDVGGGFGYKGVLLAEEVCAAFLTMTPAAAGALDRGPARAPDGRRQLPRASATTSPDTPQRTARCWRVECRGHRGFRCLLRLSVLRLPGGGAGGEHPARAVSHGGLPMPHLVGLHQQATHPAVSRRGPHRRVLRDGDGDGRACPLPSGMEPWALRMRNLPGRRGHAVHQHHREILRQRRLPRGAAARRGRRSA